MNEFTQIKNDYIRNIRTTDEKSDFISMIKNVNECIYKVNKESIVKQLEEINARYPNVLIYKDYLTDGSINLTQLSNDCTAREEYINSLKIIDVELSINPENSFIDALNNWFYTETGEPVLLDLSYRPEILGGIIFNCNGMHYDFSLNTLVDNYFRDNRASVLSRL